MQIELPSRLPYPNTPTVDTVDDYHGTPVADPYRWMEEPGAPGLTEWIEAQNDLTYSIIRAGETRNRLHRRLTELWDYPKYTVVRREADRYFYWKNSGLQNQPELYMQSSLRDEPVSVLNPNVLSEDGTAAVTGESFTDDGRLLGYALSRSGSDWQELRVRDLDSQTDLPDEIKWCKFTRPAWHPDQSGFFYSRYPEPGTVPPEEESYHQRVYWHALGTVQADDPLVYARPEARELGFQPRVTDDGRYLLLDVWKGTDPKNRVYYRLLQQDPGGVAAAPLDAADSFGFIRLLDDADARYEFIDNVGSTFYFHTDLDAPRGRIVAIDLESPSREHWREIVPEGDDTIDSAYVIHDHLVIVAMHHAHHRVSIHTLDGSYVRDVPLPGIGSVVGLTGKRHHTELFLAFTSFLYPTTVFRYDFLTGGMETVHAPDIRFDPEAYETAQEFATSKDGTRVPMFLTYKKGIRRGGDIPTLLYGYGGFNVSLTPSFSASRVVWLEAGGIYAVANLRGGGEYGESWHEAGTILKKQNVFDDFIAAAEWLVEQNYTTSKRLAIQGGSNGGLLVAACLLQRPELYGAVVCQVPVADMLRYHRFTVGRFWVTDYGNAEEDPEHFRYMRAYSPVHNAKPGEAYPATLITTADTDDRVAPAHSFKFAAALQQAQAGDAPILLRVETRAGHGQGKPTSKQIDELADVYAFLFKALGARTPPPLDP